MMTAVSPPEQRVVLDHIPWAVYEGLLAAHRDRSVPRFIYDRGRLEIMSPSPEHERLKRVVAIFVEVVAEELCINIEGLGSTTFRREDLQRGFEPDVCFYVQHAAHIRGKTELDLMVDPPPDVVIEIDLTHPALAKFPLFAQFGVPEVWRYHGSQWQIFRLAGEEYVEQAASTALPGLTAEIITSFLDQGLTLERLVWLRQVRQWVRQQHAGRA
jgi:Uma2 family endonuclease